MFAVVFTGLRRFAEFSAGLPRFVQFRRFRNFLTIPSQLHSIVLLEEQQNPILTDKSRGKEDKVGFSLAGDVEKKWSWAFSSSRVDISSIFSVRLGSGWEGMSAFLPKRQGQQRKRGLIVLFQDRQAWKKVSQTDWSSWKSYETRF